MSLATFVLIHGAYHGAWCWREVTPRLRALGHLVCTPTLTGLGERSHLIGCDPSLRLFIEDIAQVIRFEDLYDVILVGHSFAGAVISGVADLMPQRLRHLVYLDAQVLFAGESSASQAPPDLIERYRQSVKELNGIPVVPPADPAAFDITDPTLAAWVQSRLTPHPLRTYFDTLELEHPWGNGVPATYIACSEPYRPRISTSRQRARELGLHYLEIPTGHDAMLSMPEHLARMLMDIG
jgi:pimeloyl-ACP methyl ester carboxylesterase